MVEYSCWCLVVHCKILLTLLYEIFIQKTKILRRPFIIYHLYFLTVTNFKQCPWPGKGGYAVSKFLLPFPLHPPYPILAYSQPLFLHG